MASGDAAANNDFCGIVLDLGSAYTKAGFAAESAPRNVFPTVVGRFRKEGMLDGFPEVYCGEEAIMKRGVSTLTWPKESGFVNNWDDMEKLYFHTFYKELRVAPEQTHVMHVVQPLVPPRHKEKLAEILFESLAIKGLYIAKSPALVLHASGKTTGIVWECGASSAYACPVFEGFPLVHAAITSPISGKLLTKVLVQMLADRGYYFTTPSEIDIVDKIKAKHCFVATNYEEKSQEPLLKNDETSYTLPDGQIIYLAKEMFTCPEGMFQPKLLGQECSSVVDVICNSIERCDMDYSADMYKNIVISGGSSMFPGFKDRIASELVWKTKNSPCFNVELSDLNRGDLAAWAGGSVLASFSTLKNFWMTSQEYSDIGADRVNHKFF